MFPSDALSGRSSPRLTRLTHPPVIVPSRDRPLGARRPLETSLYIVY